MSENIRYYAIKIDYDVGNWIEHNYTEYVIQNKPGLTNLGGKPLVEGWLGHTGNANSYAMGEFVSLGVAIASIREDMIRTNATWICRDDEEGLIPVKLHSLDDDMFEDDYELLLSCGRDGRTLYGYEDYSENNPIVIWCIRVTSFKEVIDPDYYFNNINLSAYISADTTDEEIARIADNFYNELEDGETIAGLYDYLENYRGWMAELETA